MSQCLDKGTVWSGAYCCMKELLCLYSNRRCRVGSALSVQMRGAMRVTAEFHTTKDSSITSAVLTTQRYAPVPFNCEGPLMYRNVTYTSSQKSYLRRLSFSPFVFVHTFMESYNVIRGSNKSYQTIVYLYLSLSISKEERSCPLHTDSVRAR